MKKSVEDGEGRKFLSQRSTHSVGRGIGGWVAWSRLCTGVIAEATWRRNDVLTRSESACAIIVAGAATAAVTLGRGRTGEGRKTAGRLRAPCGGHGLWTWRLKRAHVADAANCKVRLLLWAVGKAAAVIANFGAAQRSRVRVVRLQEERSRSWAVKCKDMMIGHVGQCF